MYWQTTDSAKELPDEELLKRARSMPWLYSVLLDRYQDAFLRKARTLVFDERDVEEVVQDAFVKIYRHADSFVPQEGASFSSWAYKILINTALTRRQKLIKERERVVAIDPEAEDRISDPKETLVVRQDRDAVERIFTRLPEHFVYVLRLHYLERYSQEDIALATGENVGTIKARIHRAKAAFRASLGEGERDLL